MKEEYKEIIKEKYDDLLELVSNEKNYANNNYEFDPALSVKLYSEILKNIYEGVCFISSQKTSSRGWGRNKVYVKHRTVSFFDKNERVIWNLSFNHTIDLIIGHIPILVGDEALYYGANRLDMNKHNFKELFKEFIDLNFVAKNKVAEKNPYRELEFEKEVVPPKIKNVVDSYITKKIRDRKINSLFA